MKRKKKRSVRAERGLIIKSLLLSAVDCMWACINGFFSAAHFDNSSHSP